MALHLLPLEELATRIIRNKMDVISFKSEAVTGKETVMFPKVSVKSPRSRARDTQAL